MKIKAFKYSNTCIQCKCSFNGFKAESMFCSLECQKKYFKEKYSTEKQNEQE